MEQADRFEREYNDEGERLVKDTQYAVDADGWKNWRKALCRKAFYIFQGFEICVFSGLW